MACWLNGMQAMHTCCKERRWYPLHQSPSYREQIRYAAMQGLKHHCVVDCNSSRPNPPSATLCTTRSIFACFGLGSTIQKSTRGCSRQTVVAACRYGGICHRFTPTNSISEHAYTPFACRTGVAGPATSHSKGDDMCICIAQCTSSPPRLPVCM